jgi:molybdenum cofactor cytidylyltransferase
LKYINQYHPESTAIIVSVCDQPHLTSKHLNELVNLYNETQSEIVASSYKNTLGVPILFDQTNFEALRKINDDEGAKKIIPTQGNQVVAVPFPLGDIDLDTMEDYNTFIQ